MPLSHRFFPSCGPEVINTGVTKEALGFCLEIQVPLQDSHRQGSWNSAVAKRSVVEGLLMSCGLMDF